MRRVMPPRQVATIALRDQPGWVTFSVDGQLRLPVDRRGHRHIDTTGGHDAQRREGRPGAERKGRRGRDGGRTPDGHRRSVRHRAARAVTSSGCGCELHGGSRLRCFSSCRRCPRRSRRSRSERLPGRPRARPGGTPMHERLGSSDRGITRPRWRSSGMPPAPRPTMPTSRTRSAKRSSESARSTPRLTPSATHSPNAPPFQKAANNLILTLVKAGHGEEAVMRAKALVAEAPRDADRYFTLGLAESEQDVDAAIATFRRVLELDPGHTLARYNLALVLKRADRLPEAVDDSDARDRDRAAAEAFYTLGVIYWQQGDSDGAARALRRATAMDAALRRRALHARRGPCRAQGLERCIGCAPPRDCDQAGDARRTRHAGAGASAVRRCGRRHGRIRRSCNASARVPRSSRRRASGRRSGAGQPKAEILVGALDSSAAPPPCSKDMLRRTTRSAWCSSGSGQHDAARAAFARAAQLNPGLVPPPPSR